jgi:DNA polymerase-4
MADDVWAWCDKARAYGRTVTVKVKFADFQQITRGRSFSTGIAHHDLLRRASVKLVRTLLPTAKGVRLLGVTVSNFDPAQIEADKALPLFGTGGTVIQEPAAAPRVTAMGVS